MHANSALRRRLGQAARIIALGWFVTGAFDTQAAVPLDVSARASLNARDSCQMLMHEDSNAFVQCADTLLRKSPARTPQQRYARLGVAYYAWLSATSAAKNGLPGAAAAAEHFVLIFRPLQRQLQVGDEELCKTIEGNCVARNARMLITEQEALDRAPARQTTPSGKRSVDHYAASREK